jgi:ribonuclease D
VKYENIVHPRQLPDYCERLSRAKTIAFDTEFVSEHTYRPVLCLVQIAADEELAVIDAIEVSDLRLLWETLAGPGHETIVHAGRSELEFSLDSIGKRPAQLVDVQIAAALVGAEYPAGYGNLIGRILGKTPHKGETRTDWRKRPLSPRQLEYALDDVRYLEPLWRDLSRQLRQLGRMSWLDDEMAAWQAEVEAARARPRWRKVSGISGLASRELAIVRELWQWREQEAERRNWPVKRILRDDLIVELAKRRMNDPKHILAVRGMERNDLRAAAGQLAQCVTRALDLPESECPQNTRRDGNMPQSMLTQFLNAALASICRTAQVAPSMVGTVDDVRELVQFRTGRSGSAVEEVPALKQGWRREVVGDLLDDLLAGKVSIRIGDPQSDQPLIFEGEGDETLLE